MIRLLVADDRELIRGGLGSILGGHAGDLRLAASITRRLVERQVAQERGPERARQLERLSERETDVLRLVARGATNSEIAGQLFLSESTVKTHVGCLLGKLAARDRVQLVIFAYDGGLVGRPRRAYENDSHLRCFSFLTKGIPMRSVLRSAATLTAVALLATACSSTAGEGSGDDPLRIVGPFEIHSFQPSASSGLFTRLQVVETLVASDMAGELAPGLSPTWSASRDQRSWTFDLPDDVTFHDGTPLTPEAVAASLRVAAADEASPLAAAPITRIQGAGDAVRVRLSAAHPSLPALLTHYSTAVHAPSAYDAKGSVTEVIGTGPYRITRAELPSSVATTRFADWRGEAPSIADVTFQSVPRAESRALMATSGQADVVFGLEPAGRDRVESTDGVGMVSSLQPRTLYLKVNGEHEVLGDVRVRRALSLALDREAIAHAVLRERDLAATQLFPPSLPGWHDPELAPLAHDSEQARTLLREAGFTEGADGTLSRDGEPLRITLTTYPDRPELPALATAVQAAWRDIGVDLEVDATNSSEIPSRHQDGTLDVALLARHLALVSDPLVTVADTFAPQGSDWGVMRWQDKGVTDAVEQLLAGVPEAREQQLRAVVSSTAQEQLPVIPVAWYRMNAAVSDQVEGFVLDPLEHTWRLTAASWR